MHSFDQWAAAEKAHAALPPAGRQPEWLVPGLDPAFAYRCVGSSMAPTFYDGELVYIHPQDTAADGQIAAVEVDGGRTLKRVYRVPDGLQLVPDNPAFAPVTLTGDAAAGVRIIGIAVARG